MKQMAELQPGHLEVQAAALGFLTSYRGNTRQQYQYDLEMFFNWCDDQGVCVFDVSRLMLEHYKSYLEDERHNSAATICRRFGTVKAFYRICEIDEVIHRSPATHVKTPRRQFDEMRMLGLERNELGAVLLQARLSSPSDGALLALMGMTGLRVSEACNVKIEDIQYNARGHRVLRLVGKGSKPATVPIAIPLGRLVDAAAGERTYGYLCLRPNGLPHDRRSAARVVARCVKKAQITKRISPHSLRHSFVTAALDAGVPLRDVQIAARHSDPRITVRYDRARGNLDRHANYTVAGYLAGIS